MTTDRATPLPLTGERTVPGVAQENYWFRRHEVVYSCVAAACAGQVVLEAGCGEGYGADLLARNAHRVVAVDYDAPTLAHVRRRYPDLPAVRANLVALPMVTGGIDVLVSLQVIEHLWEQDRFLRECRRVLRPDGRLLVSTPNRLTFSPGRDTPLNPFHTRELDADELAELVRSAGFTDVGVRGLHHGPRLRELDARHGGSLIDAQVAHAVAGTSWSPQLCADVGSVRAEDFAWRHNDLAASLDLLVSARRPQ